jgi:hypothetical protein
MRMRDTRSDKRPKQRRDHTTPERALRYHSYDSGAGP